jgi:hypothetical protein
VRAAAVHDQQLAAVARDRRVVGCLCRDTANAGRNVDGPAFAEVVRRVGRNREPLRLRQRQAGNRPVEVQAVRRDCDGSASDVLNADIPLAAGNVKLCALDELKTMSLPQSAAVAV